MKKRGYFIISSIVTLVITGFVIFKGLDIRVERTPEPNPKVNENVNETPKGQPKDEDSQTEKGNLIFEEKEPQTEVVDKGPLINVPREKAEKKLDDYSYMLDKEPIVFQPEIPEYFMERKIQPERIHEYLDMSVEDRYKRMEQIELSDEQKKELKKMIEINKAIDESFVEKDYNKFLRQLHKGWREDYGVQMMGIVQNGRFIENTIDFFPEVIDLERGYAYGVYFKALTYTEDGVSGEPAWSDGLIIYKQNDLLDWEIYYEIPFDVVIENAINELEKEGTL